MTKCYVNDAGQTTIVCPACGFAKNIEVTNFKNTKKRLKAKCKCGEAFELTIEFRKHYRKNVKLPGEFIALESREKSEIIVENLSMSGIQFASLRPHQMSTGDTAELIFKLDNSARTEIRRIVKVIWIRDRNIGALFIEPKSFEKDLAFYLRS